MFQTLKVQVILLLILPLAICYQNPNSTTKSFNYTYDCSFLFEEKTCDLLNLTFASEVFSNSQTYDLEKLNEFIEESYIFKRKFIVKKASNDTTISDYSLTLSEDLQPNETLAIFFSQEEVLHSNSLGRTYMKSFPEVDFHSELPQLGVPSNDIEVTLILLYHLYHIEHSKFALNLRLLPRLIHTPVISLSEYELNLLDHFSFAYNATMQIRAMIAGKYKALSEKMRNKWSRHEIMSFLNGREEIPPQDFTYAYIILQTQSWSSMFEKHQYHYFAPVFMNLKYSDNFLINKTKIYKFMTGRDTFSTKILNRYSQKKGDILSNDIFDSKTEVIMLLHSFIPKRNDFDCVKIRVLPEYVAKDWMRESTGEECFDRVTESNLVNYHIVALHMNMDEEDLYKCEMILKKYGELPVLEKQQLVIKRCPFSGYDKVDMWNHTFKTIEEEIKPEYKDKIKKTRDYIKVRKELGLDTKNGELIRQLWEGRVQLVDEIKKKMSDYREYSLKKNKQKKEVENISPHKRFSEDKIEL